MKVNSHTKNKSNLIIGLVLCIVCVAFLVITIIAVCESFAEKARLESIGATVTLRVTWLFIVDIFAIVVSGVLGIVFLSKRTSAHSSVAEDDMIETEEDEEISSYVEKKSLSDVDEIGYDIDTINRFKAEDTVVKMEDTSPITSTEAISKPSKLKIKMGNDSSSKDTSSSDYVKSEKNISHDNKSSELSSGFFSAGDDL